MILRNILIAKTQDLSLLVDDYNKMLINAGKTVRIEERGDYILPRRME